MKEAGLEFEYEEEDGDDAGADGYVYETMLLRVLSCATYTASYSAEAQSPTHPSFLNPINPNQMDAFQVTMPRDAVHPHGMVEHRDLHNMRDPQSGPG